MKLFFLAIFLWCFFTSVRAQTNFWTCVFCEHFNYFNEIESINNEVFAYLINTGMSYSSDNGSSWNWFTPFVPSGIRYMTSTNFSLFIACDNQNIYKSQKSGSTWGSWQLLTPSGGILTGKIITAITIASWGGNLYVGTNSNGVYKFDGSFWSPSNTGIENKQITCLLRSENNSNIYAGTNDGFYKSTNNGATWNLSGFSNLYISNLSMNSNEDLIISSHNNANPIYKVHRSTNQGNDWEDVTYNLPNIEAKYISPDSIDNIFIGTENGCYFISETDTIWNEINSGLYNINIQALKYSQTGFLFVSSDSGLYRSNYVVPVELSNFNSSIFQNKVTLNWTTASEVNNSGFDVERKFDNSDWTKIAFLTGSGNTTEQTNYYYIDLISDLSYRGIVKYRLRQIDFDGTSSYSTETSLLINLIPKEYSLSQNYPNPFNPNTKIKFSIPFSGNVTIKVFDILGEEIQIVLNEFKNEGTYEIDFIPSQLTSGIYFYKIISGNFSDTKKMIFLQ
jgi:hypothetical protein